MRVKSIRWGNFSPWKSTGLRIRTNVSLQKYFPETNIQRHADDADESWTKSFLRDTNQKVLDLKKFIKTFLLFFFFFLCQQVALTGRADELTDGKIFQNLFLNISGCEYYTSTLQQNAHQTFLVGTVEFHFFESYNHRSLLLFVKRSLEWILQSWTPLALCWNPHSHPNGFYWGHGPSPQPTACRSPSCSLTTASGSNQAQSMVTPLAISFIWFFKLTVPGLFFAYFCLLNS